MLEQWTHVQLSRYSELFTLCRKPQYNNKNTLSCVRVNYRDSWTCVHCSNYQLWSHSSLGGQTMGRHSEPEGERRSGGLRWKGDTTGSIPVVPAWEAHPGITEENVEAFVAGIHAS